MNQSLQLHVEKKVLKYVALCHKRVLTKDSNTKPPVCCGE